MVTDRRLHFTGKSSLESLWGSGRVGISAVSQFLPVLLPIAGCLRQADRQTDLSSCVADAGSCSAPVSAAADGGLGPWARPYVACQLRVVFISSDVEKIKRNNTS